MRQEYIQTGQCIWCGKRHPTVTFRNKPHILPQGLGGLTIGFDICDDCNKYFGTSLHNQPCLDLVFKEIFNAYRFFCTNLTPDSHKKFSSTFFSYYHKINTIKVKSSFNPTILTKQFKRSLFYVFLQAYHHYTRNGNNTIFDPIRDFVRHNKGDLKVFYTFNNVLLIPQDNDHPSITINDTLLNYMTRYGLFPLDCMGHIFHLVIFQDKYNQHGHRYLKAAAQQLLIPSHGNEAIFELNDIRQIDFFLQRLRH